MVKTLITSPVRRIKQFTYNKPIWEGLGFGAVVNIEILGITVNDKKLIAVRSSHATKHKPGIEVSDKIKTVLNQSHQTGYFLSLKGL